MYTESYAGDWESILATMATVAAPQPTVYRILNTGKSRDQFGLTKQARELISGFLLQEIMGFTDWTRNFPADVIFDLADYGQMIVHSPKQAIRLYHRLTNRSIYGGELTKAEVKLYSSVTTKKAH